MLQQLPPIPLATYQIEVLVGTSQIKYFDQCNNKNTLNTKMIRNCISESHCILMQFVFISANDDDIDWSGFFSGPNSLNLCGISVNIDRYPA